MLNRAFAKRKLTLAGQLAPLQSPAAFAALLRTAAQPDWVVYAKRPFAGPAQVLTYLSRYTHRIAIANSRLVAIAEGKVTFRWRDYAHGYQTRIMTLAADEFLRRFLLHVLPQHFVRIRYFGLFATRHRTELLQLCRAQLPTIAPSPVATGVAHLCQHCRRGTMQVVETLSLAQLSTWRPTHLQRRIFMILHFVVMLCLLTGNLVGTSTKAAEVSAILASDARSVLHRSLYSHNLTGRSHHHSHYSLISCSYPDALSNLISFPPHSRTSFKTHRS